MIPALDSLRTVELSSLVLHEAHDKARLGRVRRGLEAEGVQRNPVIAAHLLPGGDSSEKRLLVLDGAHRVHALGEMEYPSALVQIVDLPALAEGWGHLLPAKGLEERLRAAGGVEVVEGEPTQPGDGEARLAEVRLPDGRRLSLWGDGSLARGLWALRAAYPEGGGEAADAGGYRRIEPGEQAEPGDGETVLRYRRFSPAELLEVVEEGGVLPAGVTRFIVGERILNVRLPLAALRLAEPEERDQGLRSHVRAAWESGRVRYYGEPVVLFE